MIKENKFQKIVIDRIKDLFPEAEVLKNDPNYIQGIPDLIILHKDKWAVLETKRNKHSSVRPNQEYYIDRFGKMSYAEFVRPENLERVLDELQRSFNS